MYTNGLEAGQLDPSVYLPQMLEQMKEAGAEKVMKIMQKQLDGWS